MVLSGCLGWKASLRRPTARPLGIAPLLLPAGRRLSLPQTCGSRHTVDVRRQTRSDNLVGSDACSERLSAKTASTQVGPASPSISIQPCFLIKRIAHVAVRCECQIVSVWSAMPPVAAAIQDGTGARYRPATPQSRAAGTGPQPLSIRPVRPRHRPAGPQHRTAGTGPPPRA